MEQEKYSHILVDVQSFDVISHEKICLMEKERRNAEAMDVGEFFLIWMPLYILHNVLHHLNPDHLTMRFFQAACFPLLRFTQG